MLSARYYDAYYLRAQKVRALILRDFTEAFTQVDALLAPTAPSAAFAQGDNMDDPVKMYLNDAFTIPGSMAGVPGMSVPAGLDVNGLPLGLQVIGKPFDEETVFAVCAAIKSERPGLPRCRKSGRELDLHVIAARRTIGMSYAIEGSTGAWEVVVGLEVHAQVIRSEQNCSPVPRPILARRRIARSASSMRRFPACCQ